MGTIIYFRKNNPSAKLSMCLNLLRHGQLLINQYLKKVYFQQTPEIGKTYECIFLLLSSSLSFKT